MADTPKITRGWFGDRLNKSLPRAVDWISPAVLLSAAVRKVISEAFGQFADQRPLQAAMDPADSPEALARRHDFGTIDSTRNVACDPKSGGQKFVKLDADGGLWVDFIADLGDGFEATYAMAYLMAGWGMELPTESGVTEVLKAGEIMIMGGDHSYPVASEEEYWNRCKAPYDAAFLPKQRDDNGDPIAERKLFFVAGNHDWYDGLASFTNMFCAVRSGENQGLRLGGWQSEQRRSYFALKLPHNWWIWGFDGALIDSIDVAQWRYFEAAADELQDYGKIIVITHTPAWIDKKDESLTDIVALVRDKVGKSGKVGVEVRAVLAGDLHHYTRYESDIAGHAPVNLVTSGGGGAFLHPTHHLGHTIQVRWPDKKPDSKLGFAEGGELLRDDHKKSRKTSTFRAKRASFYPSRLKSRMLAFKNLLLPFHHKPIAILIGLTYFLYAWVYSQSAPPKIEYQIPPALTEKSASEAQALGASAAAVAGQAEPTLRGFLDLASQQGISSELKASATAALTDIAGVKAALDPLQAANAAVVEAATNARKPGQTSQGDLAEKLKRAAELREISVSSAEKALSSVDMALHDYDRAATEIGRDLALGPSLAAAYAQAKTALHPLRSVVYLAKSVDERRQVLAKAADDFKTNRSREDSKTFWQKALEHATYNPAFAFMLLGLFAGLLFWAWGEPLTGWPSWIAWPFKAVIGWMHFSAHFGALLGIAWAAKGLAFIGNVLIGIILLLCSALAALLTKWRTGQSVTEQLNWFADMKNGCVANFDGSWSGFLKFNDCFALHYAGLFDLSQLLSFMLASVILGGLIGGLILGAYLALTAGLFSMHYNDAYGALGITGYKNFLRFRFDKDKVTVYAIGLKNVPSRNGWRAPLPDETFEHDPEIVPKQKLKPHLIEKFEITKGAQPPPSSPASALMAANLPHSA